MLSKSTKSMPFRELPVRRRMEVPEWLPTADIKDGEELYYKLSLVNGIPQMHRFEEDRVNEVIKTFETREDDVYLCTYVKSSTTWTQQIISLLLHEGEQSEKDYTEVVPWLEFLTLRQGTDGGPRGPYPEAKNWTLETLRSTPKRRFMKSHANLKDLPVGSAQGLKVIYVARNPKDVAVSLYHMAISGPGAKFRGFSGMIRFFVQGMWDWCMKTPHMAISGPGAKIRGFSDMLRFFVQGRCENGSWFNHVLEWWEAANADPEHILFIKYESMLAAPEEHIRKIANFAGIYHTPEIIAKTAAASSFNAMKKNQKPTFTTRIAKCARAELEDGEICSQSGSRRSLTRFTAGNEGIWPHHGFRRRIDNVGRNVYYMLI
ncbi:unnamed protein product [Ascophyllum nodosum]